MTGRFSLSHECEQVLRVRGRRGVVERVRAQGSGSSCRTISSSPKAAWTRCRGEGEVLREVEVEPLEDEGIRPTVSAVHVSVVAQEHKLVLTQPPAPPEDSNRSRCGGCARNGRSHRRRSRPDQKLLHACFTPPRAPMVRRGNGHHGMCSSVVVRGSGGHRRGSEVVEDEVTEIPFSVECMSTSSVVSFHEGIEMQAVALLVEERSGVLRRDLEPMAPKGISSKRASRPDLQIGRPEARHGVETASVAIGRVISCVSARRFSREHAVGGYREVGPRFAVWRRARQSPFIRHHSGWPLRGRRRRRCNMQQAATFSAFEVAQEAREGHRRGAGDRLEDLRGCQTRARRH